MIKATGKDTAKHLEAIATGKMDVLQSLAVLNKDDEMKDKGSHKKRSSSKRSKKSNDGKNDK